MSHIQVWSKLQNLGCFVGSRYNSPRPQNELLVSELQTTFYLPIVGVKKNPSSQMYTSLGVITKGTIIEVNISELGMVTQGGKVVWAKYAQVTNNPENDGCINAVLLV